MVANRPRMPQKGPDPFLPSCYDNDVSLTRLRWKPVFKKRNRTDMFGLKIYARILPLILLAGFGTPADAAPEGEHPVVAMEGEPSAHLKDRDKRSTKAPVALEQKITTIMPVPGIAFASCEAYISLQSHQRDTLARIASNIEYKPCARSTGEYELLIGVKDDAGVTRTLKFSETWQRDSGSPVESSKDYLIGEDVTLIRVMAQGVRCKCTE